MLEWCNEGSCAGYNATLERAIVEAENTLRRVGTCHLEYGTCGEWRYVSQGSTIYFDGDRILGGTWFGCGGAGSFGNPPNCEAKPAISPCSAILRRLDQVGATIGARVYAKKDLPLLIDGVSRVLSVEVDRGAHVIEVAGVRFDIVVHQRLPSSTLKVSKVENGQLFHSGKDGKREALRPHYHLEQAPRFELMSGDQPLAEISIVYRARFH